jgi:L-amino acid N-acyltransferase YncA
MKLIYFVSSNCISRLKLPDFQIMDEKINIQIRPIQDRDTGETLAIYRPYVEQSATSFEYDAPTESEWLERIEKTIAEYPWLVIEFENKVIGYAYASKHRTRTAYSWSVESTVYIDHNFHELGFGKVLYQTLFDILRLQGYRNVYAGVTLPNSKSVRLHKSMGFYEVGVFKNIGYKFGNWYDTGWFQLHLSDPATAPGTLRYLPEIQSDPQYEEILANANKLLKMKYLEKNEN